jgi:hypothetical protein
VTRLASLGLAAACLCACSCAINNAPADYSFEARPGTGLVVFSFTYTLTNATLYYHEVGKLASDSFGGGDSGQGWRSTPWDWLDPPGRLIVAELAPGKYEFTNWSTNFGKELVSDDFSIPFEVSAGKATYIGNVFLDLHTATRVYDVRVLDQAQRDLALFRPRYPGVRDSDVLERVTPQVIHWENPQ